MEFTTRDNHPSIDTILKLNNDDNGKFLSYLSLCSRFEGTIENWKYFDKLEEYPGYENYFYQTTILAYPMRWDSHRLLKNSLEFIKKYDEVLLKNKALTKSELMLYNLFKLEIEFEVSKNETEFLSHIENLLLENKNYFSVKNYIEFIKEYFPKYKISPKLDHPINDNFDVEYDNNNPIYSSYKKVYNSMAESVNALNENPFETDVASYSNIKRWLHKESYQSIINSLDQLNLIELKYTKVHSFPSISCELTNNILEIDKLKFTKIQQNELKIRVLKKWVDFHISCGLTMMFYMDKNLIAYWDNLTRKEQLELVNYFEKELERTDNHNYLLALKKVLKQK